jgi:hypothetical protein
MQNAEFEVSHSMRVPDVILPSQYFGAMGDCALCSEHRLMLAVLVDAINVLRERGSKAGASRRQSIGEAAAWVLARGCDSLFSFESVCGALNVDAETLRRRLGGTALRHGSTDWKRPRHLRIHGANHVQHMTAIGLRDRRSPRARNGDYRIEASNAREDDDLCSGSSPKHDSCVQ